MTSNKQIEIQESNVRQPKWIAKEVNTRILIFEKSHHQNFIPKGGGM